MAKPKPINTGNLISGIPVSPIKIQGVATLGELMNAGLKRPSDLDKIRKRDLAKQEDDVKSAYDVRNLVQRDFDIARERRANDYATYIRNVEFADGHDIAYGGVPAITLFCPDRCTDDEDGIRIPFGAVLTAIDGETQAEARFILALQDPSTKVMPLAFTLYHGIEHAHAKQILTDYNTLGERIKLQKTLGMNSTGPLTRAVLEAATKIGVEPSKLNEKGSTGTTRYLASYVQLFNAMAGADSADKALKGKLTKTMAILNKPFGKPIQPEVIEVGATLLKDCQDPSSPARRATAEIWQVAGCVVYKNGRPPVNGLNWRAAMDILPEMKKNHTPISEKLRSISKVLVT